MHRKIIPDVIDGRQALCCMGRGATACDAATTMRERKVGAVMVVEQGHLVGIVTERDMVFRLVAAGKDPSTTLLAEIMTPSPQTLTPDDSAVQALDMMRTGRYRHLPVLDGTDVIGMVSIRDLYEAIRAGLEEDLQSAETLIYGEQYGVAVRVG